MTGRQASYRSLASLQRDNRACRTCAEAGHPIESKPVFEGHEGQRAYLFGLAPGIVEGEERHPWRGRAGKALRRWLEMDEERFYQTFYLAAVTRSAATLQAYAIGLLAMGGCDADNKPSGGLAPEDAAARAGAAELGVNHGTKRPV